MLSLSIGTTVRVLEIPFEDWEAELVVSVLPLAPAEWPQAESLFFNAVRVRQTPVPISKDDAEKVARTWVILPVFSMKTNAPLALAKDLHHAEYPWFSGAAGWGAASRAPLDDLWHRVEVRVDQYGLGAKPTPAKPVLPGTTPGGFSIPATRFFADRPFVYVVVDRTLNVVLFQGRVVDPRTIAP